MTSLTTTVAKKHVKRPKVSFKVSEKEVDNMTETKENDPLPIVELKPFVQKVWRREKSFVSSLERGSSVNDRSDKSDTMSRASNSTSRMRDIEVASEVGKEDVPVSPPPRSSHSLPISFAQKRQIHAYVNMFEDCKTQKEHLRGLLGESEFKRKPKLHPPADSRSQKQPEYSDSIIPGFITRDDRTKTTLLEISEGDTSRTYSCSPKSTLGPGDMIKGSAVSPSRMGYMECSPTPVKGFHGAWHHVGIKHGSPASDQYNAKALKERRPKRVKTPLYDYIDRTGTLPSITINAKTLKKRAPRKRLDDADSEDYADYREVYQSDVEKKPHRIENSLKMLSKSGNPTQVERQLTIELERNLSRFRKSKDYSPFEINPSEMAKFYAGHTAPVFNMTQGEVMIRQALFSNAPKRHQRRVHSREAGSFTGSMLTTNSRVTQNILRRTFHHVDSYGGHEFRDASRKFDSKKEFEDEMLGTEEDEDETITPFDTPRSHMESRVSHKQSGPHATPLAPIASKDVPKAETTDKHHPTKKCEHSDNGLKANATKPEVFMPTPDNLNNQVQSNKHPSEQSSTNQELRHTNKPEVDQQTKPPTKDNTKETKVQENITHKPAGMFPEARLSNDKPVEIIDKMIDASGRTFITSDNIPQVAVANG